MDFRESASTSVMMIYATMNVFVAVSTVLFVVFMTSASSTPVASSIGHLMLELT